MLGNATLVKVIEGHFVPVVIYNNSRLAHDQEILKRFKEPAWNYQVVRFLDAQGRDLIPRKDRVWTLQPLARRMIAALKQAKRPVPDELRRLAR